MPATGLAVLISRAKEEEEEEEEEKNEGDGSYYCHSEHRPQPSHRCQHPGSHGMRYAYRLASRLSRRSPNVVEHRKR